MSGTVTIIMPVYNGAGVLQDAVSDLLPTAPWSMYRNTAPWGRLFRRAIIEKHGISFFDYKLSEDFYFNFLFLSYCHKGEVKIIEQSGYKWRIDEASESHSNMSRIADDQWLEGTFPNYKKNPELKAGRPEGETGKISFIVRSCVTLQKCGLLKTALILY